MWAPPCHIGGANRRQRFAQLSSGRGKSLSPPSPRRPAANSPLVVARSPDRATMQSPSAPSATEAASRRGLHRRELGLVGLRLGLRPPSLPVAFQQARELPRP